MFPRRIAAIPTIALFLVALPACGGGDAEVTELTTPEARAGYAFGQDIGQSLADAGIPLDVDALVQGMRDAINEREPLLSPEEAMQAMQDWQMRAQEQMMAQAESDAADNRAEGEAFLAENAQREGWTTTDSGLQYRVIEEGDGPTPGPQDRVSVHYRGTFIDGETFDSSYDRGEPAVFGVSEVISGWTEALQLMQVGGKLELAIPSDLAYGQQAPPQIGPNRVLLFEVELLGIEG
jgi:FKBP-type peptidyl-prolyl cis-trans isomerase